MTPTYNLLLAAHVIGVVLWVSGLTSIFWMLRFHDHAPKSVHEKLTLMERAMALSTDIASTVAIGCGIALAVWPSNQFSQGWLHVKLVAVLLVLAVHGMLRGRIARYGRGDLKPVPTRLWSMLLAGVAIAIFAVTTKLHLTQ
jgi:putative membrane protein